MKLHRSTFSCTLATATLSLAAMLTVFVPKSVAFAAGEEIETVGAVVSALFTVTVIMPLAAVLFDISVAIALIVCEPLLTFDVFQNA